jgi:hypothetical protein
MSETFWLNNLHVEPAVTLGAEKALTGIRVKTIETKRTLDTLFLLFTTHTT